MANELAMISVSDIERMAKAIATSKLFGLSSPEQAMALMLISQAEGTHPALAARDYHIIQGKPALKADAMMARFQQAGGRVEWIELTDSRVAAKFSHPQGGSVEIDWDMDRARAAQIGGKDMWKKFPRQMLRARVISEGIRTVFPGVVIGVYTPEEVQDFDEPKMKDVTPSDKDQGSDVVVSVENNAKSVFSNAALRNKFFDNVAKSFNEATAIAELQELALLNKSKFDEMELGSEHDKLSVDELRKRYSSALVRIKSYEEDSSYGQAAIHEQLLAPQ